MNQFLVTPIKQILLKYKKNFLLLTAIASCTLLTSCYPSFEPNRYYEGDLKVEINGEIYEFKNHWVCETHMGLSTFDMKFHPVTDQKHWPSQIYKVQSLKDGSVLIYVDWRWCKTGNFSPETFQFTILDDLHHPTYGEMLTLRTNDPATILDKRNNRYKVRLIAANVQMLNSKTKISPKGDHDKELLKILRNTSYGYQAVTIMTWRPKVMYEQILRKIDGIWDAESIDFPRESDNTIHREIENFSFIPLSKDQIREKNQKLEQVVVKYDGEKHVLETREWFYTKNTIEGYGTVNLAYRLEYLPWAKNGSQD
jgi:hypothetical protein